MSAWTDDELHRIGDATELQLTPRRSDGTLRAYTTMWVVRVGPDAHAVTIRLVRRDDVA